MDMKGSFAAIRGAIEKSAAECSSQKVISVAYAVVHLIGGVLLSSARLLGSAGPFGIAAVAASGAGLNGVGCLIGAAIGYIISSGLAGSIRYLAAIVLVYTVSFACYLNSSASVVRSVSLSASRKKLHPPKEKTVSAKTTAAAGA